MNTLRKKIIVFAGLFLIGIIAWFAYDVHFKYEINEYQARLIEEELKKDFTKNAIAFKEISEFQSDIGNISDLVFYEADNYISFQIKSDSLSIYSDFPMYISAGETLSQDIKFASFSEDGSVVIDHEGEEFTIEKPWIISFDGKTTNADFLQLIESKNIDLVKLNRIKTALWNTSGIGFEKNDSVVLIRYAGHWGESFNYALPLSDFKPSDDWEQLSEEWYSVHIMDGLYCGWTDW